MSAAPAEVERESDAPSEPVDVWEALLAAQAELPTLPKDKTNPHFHSKFTGLETIVETVGPILNRHGLVWVTLPARDEQGNPELRYRLRHATSGSEIAGAMPLLLSKGDSQGLGSAITYARRYALSSVLNLVADEDDDGNAASPEVSQAGGSRVSQAGPPEGAVNLQNEAKGLRNEAINAAFAKVGLPAQAKPWGQLGQIPEDKADAMRDALEQQRAMS